MNEELQKALASLLAKTTSAAEAGVSFLQAELPEVIHQLLMWKAVESALFFVVALVLIPVAWGVAIRVEVKMASDKYAPHNFGYFVASMASVGLLCCAALSLDWLKIWVAPKVYLIEYAASLAK